MAKIVTLKDKDNTTLYPQVTVDSLANQVDNVPISGSDKIVKSGGVASAINTVWDGKINEALLLSTIELGRISSTDGSNVNSAYNIRTAEGTSLAGGVCTTIKVKCAIEELTSIVSNVETVRANVVLYDGTGQYVNTVGPFSLDSTFCEFPLEKGVELVRFFFLFLDDENNSIDLTSYVEQLNTSRNLVFNVAYDTKSVSSVSAKIDLVEGNLPTMINAKTYSTFNFVNVGGYITNNGEKSDNDGYRCSDFLNVVIGESVTGYYNHLVSFFDKDKNFISELSGIDNGTDHVDTIVFSGSNVPEGAVYFTATTLLTKLSSSSIAVLCSTYAPVVDDTLSGDISNLQKELHPEIKETSFSSDKSRINTYIDNTPNFESYYIKIDCPRTDRQYYSIAKCDTSHTSATRELIKSGIYYGQRFLIEKDDEKPSLFIYTGGNDITFEAPVAYSVTFEDAADTFESKITNLSLEEQSWSGKNIVVFGDSITEFSYVFPGLGEMRYSDWISYITKANVVNLGIGGTRICPRYSIIPVFDEYIPYAVGDYVFYGESGSVECYQFTHAHEGVWKAEDVAVVEYDAHYCYSNLDIHNMVASCCDTSISIDTRFANQIAAADYISTHSADDNTAVVAQLPSIDWSKVDAVIIMGGNNDWSSATPNGSSTDNNPTTLRGAINSIISHLLSTYQHLKLYWFTPPVAWEDYIVGQQLPSVNNFSDNLKKYGRTLKELSALIKEQVSLNHIPAGDLYNEIGWNMSNFSYYFNKADGTHPGRGYESIGRYMVSKIKSYQTF